MNGHSNMWKVLEKKGAKHSRHIRYCHWIRWLQHFDCLWCIFFIFFLHSVLHTLCWTFQWRKCANQINWKYLLESPSKLRAVRPSKWAITWAKRKPKPVENIVVTSHKFQKDQHVYYTMFGEIKCKRWKRSHKDWDRFSFCEWHAFCKRFILPGCLPMVQITESNSIKKMRKKATATTHNICVSHLIWSAANKNRPYQNQAGHVYCWSDIRNSKGHSHCMTTK